MIRNIILFCLLMTVNFMHSQKVFGEAIYVKRMLDITKKIKENSSKKSFLEFRERINNNLKKVTYTLNFNESESLFYSSKIMENDINRGVNLAINFGGGRGILYTNLKNKIKLHQADGYGEKFLIKGKIEFKWEITQETKKIGNYNCYKAILKEKLSKKSKNTIAWFSAEIPYSFGPNGYCGLPGLILELELNNGFLFKVTDIHLKKEASKKIVKPSKGIKISEEEFLDLGKKSSENLIKN